jgi:hypothetical protein
MSGARPSSKPRPRSASRKLAKRASRSGGAASLQSSRTSGSRTARCTAWSGRFWLFQTKAVRSTAWRSITRSHARAKAAASSGPASVQRSCST